MTIIDLITQAQSALVYLSMLRSSAERLGDTEQIARIDAQTSQTQATLNALLTLPSAS
jgi:hypothetical protein